MGISFVVSVFLQEVRGLQRDPDGRRFHRRDGRHPPLVFRPAAAREAVRAAKLIIAGFVVTLAAIALLLGFVHTSSRVVAFVPGLLLIGLGVGAMLTPSVNVVQSSFPEALQGEISGLSRAISNLGSSFGTAIAGTILVSVVALGFPLLRGRADRPHRDRPPRPRRRLRLPARSNARSRSSRLNHAVRVRACGRLFELKASARKGVDPAPAPGDVEQREQADALRQRGVDDEMIADGLEAEHRAHEQEQRPSTTPAGCRLQVLHRRYFVTPRS